MQKDSKFTNGVNIGVFPEESEFREDKIVVPRVIAMVNVLKKVDPSVLDKTYVDKVFMAAHVDGPDDLKIGDCFDKDYQERLLRKHDSVGLYKRIGFGHKGNYDILVESGVPLTDAEVQNSINEWKRSVKTATMKEWFNSSLYRALVQVAIQNALKVAYQFATLFKLQIRAKLDDSHGRQRKTTQKIAVPDHIQIINAMDTLKNLETGKMDIAQYKNFIPWKYSSEFVTHKNRDNLNLFYDPREKSYHAIIYNKNIVKHIGLPAIYTSEEAHKLKDIGIEVESAFDYEPCVGRSADNLQFEKNFLK